MFMFEQRTKSLQDGGAVERSAVVDARCPGELHRGSQGVDAFNLVIRNRDVDGGIARVDAVDALGKFRLHLDGQDERKPSQFCQQPGGVGGSAGGLEAQGFMASQFVCQAGKNGLVAAAFIVGVGSANLGAHLQEERLDAHEADAQLGLQQVADGGLAGAFGSDEEENAFHRTGMSGEEF